MSFTAWMRHVDMAVQNIAGVSVHDLADQNFRDMYEDGVSAVEAADEILENEGWDA